MPTENTNCCGNMFRIDIDVLRSAAEVRQISQSGGGSGGSSGGRGEYNILSVPTGESTQRLEITDAEDPDPDPEEDANDLALIRCINYAAMTLCRSCIYLTEIKPRMYNKLISLGYVIKDIGKSVTPVYRIEW